MQELAAYRRLEGDFRARSDRVMDTILFSGVLHLPWWGVLVVTCVLTHVTVVGVTVFLHRNQAHRALDLHPVVSHFFRLWLWLTTGMVTREWVAIHRKHHAKVDTSEDPHSPQVLGLHPVLWTGVRFYVKESRNHATIARYSHGTPQDGVERMIYSRYSKLGPVLMGLVDVGAFGLVPGALVCLLQIAWIPFWAAGVINGLGHHLGYRNWSTQDASANIVPWGILIGGEELHNNHHAFPTSAKLSSKWYEIDIGWMYIRMLEMAGLAKVHRVATAPRFVSPAATPNLRTLQAIMAHRYDVLAQYARSLGRIFDEERQALRWATPRGARLRDVHRWLGLDPERLRSTERVTVANLLAHSRALRTVYTMRADLVALWSRSMASEEQLVRRLQEWCRQAEESGIAPLVEFSLRLRSYS